MFFLQASPQHLPLAVELPCLGPRRTIAARWADRSTSHPTCIRTQGQSSPSVPRFPQCHGESPGLEKTHPKWSQRIILKWKSNRNINTVTQLIIKQVCMPHVTMFFISFTTSMASPRRVLVFTKYSTGWPRSFSRTLCNLQLAMACPNARGMAFQVCWPPHSPLGTNNLEQVCQILEVSADIKRNNLAEPLSSPLLMVAAWSQYHFGGDLKSWICQKKWNNQLQCTVPAGCPIIPCR